MDETALQRRALMIGCHNEPGSDQELTVPPSGNAANPQQTVWVMQRTDTAGTRQENRSTLCFNSFVACLTHAEFICGLVSLINANCLLSMPCCYEVIARLTLNYQSSHLNLARQVAGRTPGWAVCAQLNDNCREPTAGQHTDELTGQHGEFSNCRC